MTFVATWSETEIQTASSMWKEDKTAAEIAERIGVSRNAVAGLAHRRRDLFPPRGKGRPTIKTVVARMGRDVAANAAATDAAPALVERPRYTGPQVSPEAWDRAHGVTRDLSRFALKGRATIAFADLRPRQCKFPLEAFEVKSGPQTPCCGAPTEELASYCGAHRAVVRGVR